MPVWAVCRYTWPQAVSRLAIVVTPESYSVISFRAEDENHPTVKPDRIVNNLAGAVDLLLQEE